MSDLFQAAFHAVNIIPSILLCLVLLYWLMVILGAMDLGFGGDINMEMEAEVEVDADISTSPTFMNEVLSFFNIGKVPFMVFFTALVLPMWFISMNLNHILSIESFVISLVLLIPNFLVCMFIAKLLTIPLISLFKNLNDEGRGAEDLLGRPCIITLTCSSDSLGQVEVKIEGDSYILNAKTRGGLKLERGTSAIVVDQVGKGGYYIVAPMEH